MSHTYLHMNDSIFEEPKRFVPERWLAPDASGLDSWLVPFSRGPRMCLGVK